MVFFQNLFEQTGALLKWIAPKHQSNEGLTSEMSGVILHKLAYASIPSNFLLYLDANNLYGWAMCQKLPTGDFHFVDQSLIDVLNGEREDTCLKIEDYVFSKFLFFVFCIFFVMYFRSRFGIS